MPRGVYPRAKRGGEEHPKPTREHRPEGTLVTAQTLTQRQRELAMRSRERKTISIGLKYTEYDELLSMAERWDEDFAIVVRAVFRKGLEYYRQWATGDRSPFGDGDLTPRRPSKWDEQGYDLPAPVAPVFARAPFVPAPLQSASQNHNPLWSGENARVTTTETVDAVFGIPAGVLPNGATMHDPPPARPPEPESPEEVPFEESAAAEDGALA